MGLIHHGGGGETWVHGWLKDLWESIEIIFWPFDFRYSIYWKNFFYHRNSSYSSYQNRSQAEFIKISQHTFCNFQDFLSVWILESNVSELCSCKYFKSINSIKEIRYWYRVSQKKLVFRISALYGIYCSLWALQRPSYYW